MRLTRLVTQQLSPISNLFLCVIPIPMKADRDDWSGRFKERMGRDGSSEDIF